MSVSTKSWVAVLEQDQNMRETGGVSSEKSASSRSQARQQRVQSVLAAGRCLAGQYISHHGEQGEGRLTGSENYFLHQERNQDSHSPGHAQHQSHTSDPAPAPVSCLASPVTGIFWFRA